MSLLYVLISGTQSKFAWEKKIPSARRLLSRHHKARSAYEQQQLRLGEEIESFEISRRLIAQKSKIPNPTLKLSFIFASSAKHLLSLVSVLLLLCTRLIEEKVRTCFPDFIITRLLGAGLA